MDMLPDVFPFSRVASHDEKVVAFYRSQKGSRESKAISIGNDATRKMTMFSVGDYGIVINWPADVYVIGKVVARRQVVRARRCIVTYYDAAAKEA